MYVGVEKKNPSNFELYSGLFPPGVTNKQTQTNNCQVLVSDGSCVRSCHLSQRCFDYNRNMWWPSRCPSVEVDRAAAGRCLDRTPGLFIGDSRSGST